MSNNSNVTEQDLINLRKLANQQKEQRVLKIKNKILKETHDKQLVDSFSPSTGRLDEVNKSTKESGEIVKKSQPSQNIETILQNSESQTPAIDTKSTSQSLRDTLSFMKTSKNFFKLEQYHKKVFWNKIPVIPQGEIRVSIKGKEFDTKPNIQNYFTNTKLTNKNMSDEDKSTVYDIRENTGFYSMRHTKGLN